MELLTIEGNLPSLNEYTNANRTNKYAGGRVKRKSTELVSLYCKAQLKEKYKKVFLEIDWYEKDEKKDPDNIIFAKKFILDGLVEAGIVKNDNRKHVAGFKERVLTDKLNPRIEVRIYESESYIENKR